MLLKTAMRTALPAPGLRSLRRCRAGYATTSSQSPGGLQIPKINADRMMKDLHYTCEWGKAFPYEISSSASEEEKAADPSTWTGMRRLTLDDNDKKARDWFVEETRKLGCHVSWDNMGNITAVRPDRHGRISSAYETGNVDGEVLPPTAMGSHLDTQPEGGRYDGILGIHAALEAFKTMNEHNVQTAYPTAIVNWTNEEGARFPRSVLSSGVWADLIPLQEAWDLKEVPSLATNSANLRTFKQELERIGYLGNAECSYKTRPLAAHFELHIEQGPLLKSAEKRIGAVQGGQAYLWATVEIIGKAAHTGSTPWSNRVDALQCAAHALIASKKIAQQHGGLCSTGILSLEPGSTNVIPSTVRFTLDMRHAKSDEALREMEMDIITEISRLASITYGFSPSEGHARPCEVRYQVDSVSKLAKFHPDCIKSVRESAKVAGRAFANAGGASENLTLDLFSGAGHDTCATSTRVPSTMIFAVSERDGISHHPTEYTTPSNCAIGAQTLLGAVLHYDKLRESQAA